MQKNKREKETKKMEKKKCKNIFVYLFIYYDRERMNEE
jgi:hypothetical protein